MRSRCVWPFLLFRDHSNRLHEFARPREHALLLAATNLSSRTAALGPPVQAAHFPRLCYATQGDICKCPPALTHSTMDEWRLFGADPARTHTGIVYQPASPARRELFGKEEKAPTGRRWIDRFLWKSRKPSIRVTSGESCDSLFLLFFFI